MELIQEEEIQVKILLKLIFKKVHNDEYQSDKRYAFCDNIKNLYLKECDLVNIDTSNSIRLDTSDEKFLVIIGIARNIFEEAIINNNHTILETLLERKVYSFDIDHIFDYNNIFETLHRETALDIKNRSKPTGEELEPELLNRVSSSFGIPIETLKAMEQKDICKTLAKTFGIELKDREESGVSKDEVHKRIDYLEEIAKEKGLIDEDGNIIHHNHKVKINGEDIDIDKITIERGEERKVPVPSIISDHIQSIENISDIAKKSSLEVLEECSNQFTEEFLKEFEESDFSKRSDMIESILLKYLKSAKERILNNPLFKII